MATSPNYSWPEPDNTDLVKNGALAIRTMGNAIDTTMATMTPKSTYTAKGSIAAATGASTPANLSVGNNGETLVADSSTSTGLRYQSNFAAGKNKIINGDFGIWQRGTSFSVTGTYNADRWLAGWDSTPTVAITRQTFTPATAPVAGYEGQFYQRTAVSAAASMTLLDQKQYIEDVRTYAGQTVTVSFWAKADAARTISFFLLQNFGSSGSGDVVTSTSTISATTSWVRYSATIAVPSISGKTVGTSSYLALYLRFPGSTFTIDIWGVQVEAGSVATAFQTATGTIQGELAACQRYYWRSTAGAAYSVFGGNCSAWSSTDLLGGFALPVTMRTNPTSVEYSSLMASDGVNNNAVGTLTFSTNYSSPNVGGFSATSTGLTAYRYYRIQANNSSSAYIAYSAEL
jgi:hypothetical protein